MVDEVGAKVWFPHEERAWLLGEVAHVTRSGAIVNCLSKVHVLFTSFPRFTLYS